jgi:hypothetical protein
VEVLNKSLQRALFGRVVAGSVGNILAIAFGLDKLTQVEYGVELILVCPVKKLWVLDTGVGFPLLVTNLNK